MFEKQKMNEFTPGKDVPIEPTWGVTYDGPRGLSSREEKLRKKEEGGGKMIGLRFNENPKFSHRMTPKQYEQLRKTRPFVNRAATRQLQMEVTSAIEPSVNLEITEVDARFDPRQLGSVYSTPSAANRTWGGRRSDGTQLPEITRNLDDISVLFDEFTGSVAAVNKSSFSPF